ncbi:hypothetical protein [Paraburkholderia sp.]|jgi:hypothetical protein|uniref:hypothetical protein n=1 Tax=Paraburkholderia sp. TaxID=1926495 RepID=UPI002F406A09
MKTLFVLTAAGAGLLLAAGATNGQGMDMQSPGRAIFEQNANESAQSATDMRYSDSVQSDKGPSGAFANTSYGGTADTQGQAGGPRCTFAPHCNIYRGH